MQNTQPTLDEIVSLCKRRGYVYPTSAIYGGLANSYDYGPLGSQLLKNIKDLWWKEFISKRNDMVGLDSQILLNPETWVASGHVGSFSDPLVDDLKSKKRYRADHLIEDWVNKQNSEKFSDFVVENLSVEEMGKFIKDNGIKSPDGNEVSEPKQQLVLYQEKKQKYIYEVKLLKVFLVTLSKSWIQAESNFLLVLVKWVRVLEMKLLQVNLYLEHLNLSKQKLNSSLTLKQRIGRNYLNHGKTA